MKTYVKYNAPYESTSPYSPYDLKFGSETVADPSQDGFGVGRKDEGVKGGVSLNCDIASLTQKVT